MSKLTVTKLFGFEACHHLPNHSGKCANVHGHSYKLEITVQAGNGDEGSLNQTGSSEGMVIDFSNLKSVVNDLIINKFDHADLNEVLSYRPTAENMVVDIMNTLNEYLGQISDYRVVKVRLWETADSYAEVAE